MQKFAISKPTLLRILLGVFVFPLLLVVFSLSVPPGDLPLCGSMLILSVFGLILAWREGRTWRLIWVGALIFSVIRGGLEIVAGQRIARQRPRHESRSANPARPLDAPITRLFGFGYLGRRATDVQLSATMLCSALIIVFCALLSGCTSAPQPGLSLIDARVVEGPVLIERSGHIYLRYRRALEDRGSTLLSLLYHKKEGDAAYYFFSVPISHQDWGNLIERPLAYDGTEELARNGRVFWLDPDGSKHPIPLKKESNHSGQQTRAISACSQGGRNSQLSPSSESERACVEAFKKQAGQNRLETWKMLQPLLTSRLASVPRTRTALKDFFEQWLGPSEREALKRSEGASVWALSPTPNRGDVLAYQLSNKDHSTEDLVVDFRNPEKVELGVSSAYAPPPKQGPHDQISGDERQIAAELNATEINLGGASQDGSAKTGFWIRLGGLQATEENVRRAAKLATLVSLELSGKAVNNACLLPLKGHAYLASLDLNSTSISDAGLAHLTGLGALKWLTIDDAPVTEQGVRALRTALPKCEIEFRKR